MTQFKEAIEGVLSRRASCSLADAHYDGTVSEVWGSAMLSRRLGRNTKYRLNLAAVVVDAVNNRLEIDAVIAADTNAQDALNTILEQNEMALESSEIHKRTLIYGECFVIVWPDEDGDVEISYNAPTNAGIVYSNENQRKKEYGYKTWVTTVGEQKETRLNLYFKDRIEKYSAKGEVTSANANTWSLIDTVDNPFGQIPMFHFRTSRPHGSPEHYRAYGPQDMVNKLVNTHMDTVDYQGAPQRYALTGAMDDTESDAFDEGDDTDRENMDGLRNGPGELWYLKGVHNVGQFQPADHKVFTEPVAVYTRQMASSTDTPMHYFERTGNVPSGEALRTAEAPLIKKVNDRQLSFGSTWRDIYRFGLLIEGIDSDVQIKWKPAESMDPLDAWEMATRKKLVGVSPYTIFLEMGYDSEIAKTMADAIDEKVAASAQPGMNMHNLEKQVTKEEGASE